MLSVNNQHGKAYNRRSATSVVSWAVSFEKVLEDSIGLKIFTEFLKREFSAENIKFWTICELYRKQSDKQQRTLLAREIVANHLCTGAPEPVNIDSQSRQKATQEAELAHQDLFISAQKQIFSLMKFDCYQRFLKSDLFTESLTAERLGKPLPYQDTIIIKNQKKCRSRSKSRDRNRLLQVTKVNVVTESKKCSSSTSSTEENSAKEEMDEKKRKSLLPWQKVGRGRSADPERSSSRSPVLRERNANSRRYKTKFTDKSISNGKSVRTVAKVNKDNVLSSKEHSRLPIDEGVHGRSELCRVILPDSSATVLHTNLDEVIGEAIQKLISKHGLPMTAIESFAKSTSKAIDLSSPISNFGGHEVLVEYITLVRLEMPSKETLVVKSRPDRTCLEALEPVLKKYGLDIWKVSLQFASSNIPVNLNGPISAANKCQIHVQMKDLEDTGLNIVSCEAAKDRDARRKVNSFLFDEVIKDCAYFRCDELGILDLEYFNIKSKQTVNRGSDGILRKNSLSFSKDKVKQRHVNRSSIHEGMNNKNSFNESPLPQMVSTTPRRNPSKNVHYRDSCDLSGVWSRAQKRLDDQRGTELNCELPDFLKQSRDN